MEKGDGTAKMCVGGGKKIIQFTKKVLFDLRKRKRENTQVMEANLVMSRDALSAAAGCVDNSLTLSPDCIKRG